MVVKIEDIKEFDRLWSQFPDKYGVGRRFVSGELARIKEDRQWNLLRRYITQIEEAGYTVYYHCRKQTYDTEGSKTLLFLLEGKTDDERRTAGGFLLSLLSNLANGTYEEPKESTGGVGSLGSGSSISCPLF